MSIKTTVWNLSAKSGRRFRHGHPWVFANELMASPKGITPGGPVELRDEKGLFLARGYGNANSLIAFRVLSRLTHPIEPWSEKALAEKAIAAAEYRKSLGFESLSCRLVFGEADQLPGLVIDRYVHFEQRKQVLVVQVLTAGIELHIPQVNDWVGTWVESATGFRSEDTAIVVRRDVGTRKLEGLEIREPEIFGIEPSELESFPMRLRGAHSHQPARMTVNLISGQKTGFFFDQASNVELLLAHLPDQWPGDIRVLDLFCYVGQWSSQITQELSRRGARIHAHLVDASGPALQLAKANVEALGGVAFTHELDILEGLPGIPDCEVVICDPPAFIKSKKDHGPGLRGYLKANTLALGKVKPGGWFVSCSCSHHLSDEDMITVLRQAEGKAHKRVRWLGRGVQAPDHPIILSFPEGQYLKAWVGRVEP